MGYHLFTAQRGVLHYTAFGSVDNFLIGNLKRHGLVTVEACGHRMNYTPNVPGGDPEDFTPFLQDAA